MCIAAPAAFEAFATASRGTGMAASIRYYYYLAARAETD